MLLLTGDRRSGLSELVRTALLAVDFSILWIGGYPKGSGQHRNTLAALDNLKTNPGAIGAELVICESFDQLDLDERNAVTQLATANTPIARSWLFIADERADLTEFGEIEEIRLGPLSTDELSALVTEATGVQIAPPVAELLARACGGIPALAYEVIDQCSIPQLSGYEPIPLPILVQRRVVDQIDPELAALPRPELLILAAFAHQSSIPLPVLRAIDPEPALADLLRSDRVVSHLGLATPRSLVDAVLAWSLLEHEERQQLHRLLSQAWRSIDPLRALAHRLQLGSAVELSEVVAASRQALRQDRGDLVAIFIEVAHASRLYQTDPRAALQLGAIEIESFYLPKVREILAWGEHNITTDTVLQAELLRLRAALASMTAEHIETVPRGADSVQLLGPDPDAILSPMIAYARLYSESGSPEETRRILNSLQVVEDQIRPATLAELELTLAEIEMVGSDETARKRLLGAALAWVDQIEDPPMAAATLAVYDLLALGQITEARRALVRAGMLVEGLSPLGRLAHALCIAEIEYAAGRYRKVTAHVDSIARDVPVRIAPEVTASLAVRVGAVTGNRDLIGLIPDAAARSGERANRHNGTLLAAHGLAALVGGDYGRSRAMLRQALREHPLVPSQQAVSLADLVEAGVAAGDLAGARVDFDRFEASLTDRDGERGPALVTRCQALIAPPTGIDEGFRRALALSEQGPGPDHARTMLAYGRVLLGMGQLKRAAAMVDEAGIIFGFHAMNGWQEHAKLLIKAPVPGKSPQRSGMTETENRIIDGVLMHKRNQEIAAELYVSLRTVEAHLTRIFRTLGVSGKRGVREVLRDTE